MKAQGSRKSKISFQSWIQDLPNCNLPRRSKFVGSLHKRIIQPVLVGWVLAVTLVLGFIAGALIVETPSLAAEIPTQDRLGHPIYQSRETLRDQAGRAWQVILFKQSNLAGENRLSLRLVGFPGVVTIAHGKPLTIVNGPVGNPADHSANVQQAADVSGQIFKDEPLAPNVGQYDMQTIVPHLRPELPLSLRIETEDISQPVIRVPSLLVQEWQTIAQRPFPKAAGSENHSSSAG